MQTPCEKMRLARSVHVDRRRELCAIEDDKRVALLQLDARWLILMLESSILWL
jgi:hypothetical protein